jgi:L-ribulose-5-phosphate 3-epimerase
MGWEKFTQAFAQAPDSVLCGPLDPLDFAEIARRDFDIDAIEYVNNFYFGRGRDDAYLDQPRKRADDSLHQHGELAQPLNLHVLVENHGGLSSDGSWLVGVMEAADHPRVGTLPDFGNFRLSPRGETPEEHYDRYLGVAELMPYAQAVSAKSYDFDAAGEETTIDFQRMLEIVTGAGYSGYVGIEYEGQRLSEVDGILATRRLLERIRDARS